jgi:hypothetical protein
MVWRVREMLDIPHPGSGNRRERTFTRGEMFGINLYKNIKQSRQKRTIMRRIFALARSTNFVMPKGCVIVDNGESASFAFLDDIEGILRKNPRPLLIIPSIP